MGLREAALLHQAMAGGKAPKDIAPFLPWNSFRTLLLGHMQKAHFHQRNPLPRKDLRQHAFSSNNFPRLIALQQCKNSKWEPNLAKKINFPQNLFPSRSVVESVRNIISLHKVSLHTSCFLL
jgi:hypothetical protein